MKTNLEKMKYHLQSHLIHPGLQKAPKMIRNKVNRQSNLGTDMRGLKEIVTRLEKEVNELASKEYIEYKASDLLLFSLFMRDNEKCNISHVLALA